MIALPPLNEHLLELFSPGLEPQSFKNRVACLLRKVPGCKVVSFASLSIDSRQLEIDFDPYFPEIADGLPAFGKYMAKYPCFNFDPTVAGGKPFLRGDFMSDEEYYASDIYQEAFKLAGFTDHAAIPLPAHENSAFFIGLERAGGVFRDADRKVLEWLQPHLANAYLLAKPLASLEKAVADPSVFLRAGLSSREAEVLYWLAQGNSNSDISGILHISLPTVKTHIKRVFDKLGVENRHAAILRAYELAAAANQAPPAEGAARAVTYARALV